MSIFAWCRRGIGGLCVSGLLALPVSGSFAQSVPVLGYVAAKNANPKRLDIFRQGLTELGYVEGKNLMIDYREAVLDDEYSSIMDELIGRKVDIILAANIAAAVAAAKKTSTIPIVMLAVNDPVGAGFGEESGTSRHQCDGDHDVCAATDRRTIEDTPAPGAEAR